LALKSDAIDLFTDFGCFAVVDRRRKVHLVLPRK